MRIRQFCVHVEFKHWVKSQFFVSHLDDVVLTSLDNCTGVDWLDNRINWVFKVLNKHWFTIFDCHFKARNHFLSIRQSSYLKVLITKSLLQPSDTLQLRVNDKRIPFWVCHDCTVLKWNFIRRQLFILPFGHLCFIGQDAEGIWVLTQWNLVYLEEGCELIFHYKVSVLFVKRSNVRDKWWSHQHISEHDL